MQNKITHASLLLLFALRNTTPHNSRSQNPRTELHEIAVVFIQGGLRGALGSDQHYTTNPAQIAQLYHARAEALLSAVFKYLRIPSSMWGDAVEDRPLPIVGEKDPYIGTLNTAEPLASIFGDDNTVTHVFTLELELLLDVKTKAFALVSVTVEVGIAGMYDYFKHLGKRGKKVALSSPDTGIHLTLTLDCNPKAYSYLSDNWQKFAAFCATNHLETALTVDLGAGSLKILAGVLVHRAARPRRQRPSVLCFVW
jgi:hypothetical protein